MNTPGSAWWSCMRTRSPSIAPPVNGLRGIDREYRDRRCFAAKRADELVDESALARSRRTGDADDGGAGRCAGKFARSSIVAGMRDSR